MPRLQLPPGERSRSLRHHSVASQDTDVSGVADSTISFSTRVTGESLGLSQFPDPPTEIPITPVQSEFGIPSPSKSNFSVTLPATPSRHGSAVPVFRGTAPLLPKRKYLETTAEASQGSSLNKSEYDYPRPVANARSGFPGSPTGDAQREEGSSRLASYSSRVFSPHDWHEGASSIDVDATEDRLLSTSFITSLLQESTDPQSHQSHISDVSDAMSAVSEMTYPPYSRYAGASLMRPPPPYRPQGGRPPPSAFIPVSQSSGQSDSDTLGSTRDDNDSARTATLSYGFGMRGASVVGVAPATFRSTSTHNGMQTFMKKYRPSTGSSVLGQYNGARESVGDGVDEKFDTSGYALPPSVPYSAALSSTVGAQSHFLRDSSRGYPESRKSTHSTKSYIPSLISRLSSASGSASSKSIRRAFDRLRVRPLPAVPALPSHVPIASEVHKRKAVETTASPDIVSRTDNLSHLLDKEHRSLTSYTLDGGGSDIKGEVLASAFDDPDTRESSAREVWDPARDRKHWPKRKPQEPWATPHGTLKLKSQRVPLKKKRIIIISGLAFFLLLIAIAVAVGVTVTKKRREVVSCPADLTGAACNLNATCVCTSALPCDPLSQHLVSLQPILNQLFATNFTINSISNSLWIAQGAPLGDNCASQSLLVDVGPALGSNTPNRTQWAQSALLWNLIQSQDLDAVKQMQNFVVNAPWDKLDGSDGPISDGASTFSFAASGFAFDFASQRFAPQTNVTFISDGEPTNAQITQVGVTAQSALDRMYTFAFASSIQRNMSLAKYWRTVLQQKPQDLPAFVSALASSPILLPFDATFSQQSPSLESLLTNSSTAPFPPPLACYPGLNPVQAQSVNSLESSVFGLPSIKTAAAFNASCFPDRPIYGVLNVLRLRLPFFDSKTDLVPKQAAILQPDVAPRVVVYNGETLSGLPTSSNSSAIVVENPLEYGTLNHLNHVVFNYLSSIPDTNVTTALINFVLSSSTLPPTNSTISFQLLASIPVLEVAVFGSINPSDIHSAVSSFSTPSGSLFFGSEQGTALRNWAIGGAGSSVAWAEFAASPLVVRDSSLTDVIFNQTWLAASTHNLTANVGNVTSSFNLTQKFGP